jgi:hypothetical protein
VLTLDFDPITLFSETLEFNFFWAVTGLVSDSTFDDRGTLKWFWKVENLAKVAQGWFLEISVTRVSGCFIIKLGF